MVQVHAGAGLPLCGGAYSSDLRFLWIYWIVYVLMTVAEVGTNGPRKQVCVAKFYLARLFLIVAFTQLCSEIRSMHEVGQWPKLHADVATESS